MDAAAVAAGADCAAGRNFAQKVGDARALRTLAVDLDPGQVWAVAAHGHSDAFAVAATIEGCWFKSWSAQSSLEAWNSFLQLKHVRVEVDATKNDCPPIVIKMSYLQKSPHAASVTDRREAIFCC